MGQVQRRQQQDIELWELYEEEAWEAGRSDRGRNVNGSSRRMDRDRGRGDGRRVRQSEKPAEVRGEAGRNRKPAEARGEADRSRKPAEARGEAGRSGEATEAQGGPGMETA